VAALVVAAFFCERISKMEAQDSKCEINMEVEDGREREEERERGSERGSESEA
jgi:hypothetical protein